MSWLIGRLEHWLLPIALLLLTSIGIFAFRDWREYRRANEEVQASQSVLDHVERLLAAITDAETGQRGFLLTARQEYLATYNSGLARIPGELAALQQLSGDERPQQAGRLRQLDRLVAEKTGELRHTIRLRETAGFAAALAEVQTDAGKKAMDSIRHVGAEMEAYEYGRVRARADLARRQGQRTLLIAVAGGTCLFVLIALATVVIRRATRYRERLIADLHERRELLQTTLSSIGDAVIVTNAGGRVTFLNGIAQSLTGWPIEEALDKPLDELFVIVHEETAAPVESPFARVVREGRITALANQTEMVNRQGRHLAIEDSSAPIRSADGTLLGMVLIFRDVTEARRAARERQRFEEQLREAAKLESLGVLAGGIAHDFNNLLVGIIGNASLAMDTLPGGHRVRRLLEQILEAGERAAKLTRQMLAYAGKGKFVVERVDLSKRVREALPLIQSSIPREIKLQLELEPGLPAIQADASQIDQVITNLVINAAEAFAEGTGLIRVATGRQFVDEQYGAKLSALTEIEPGEYVFLEVQDTGSGMEAATREKIFDPFFSTKFTGRGLGLAAVLGIVRGHRGGLVVESEPGYGSTFRALFPVAAAG